MASPYFPRKYQANDYTCAPCCVSAVLEYRDCSEFLWDIKEDLGTDEDGTSSSAFVLYACPVTGERTCIPFEDAEDHWDCAECGEPVSVVWHGGLWDVRHSLEYE